jgi:HSP20 family molecular chaperone IbpA
MRASLELMRDHVRAIHRSVTGSDPPEATPNDARIAPSFDEVSRRFAELEAMARAIPTVAERIPPFSFAPPLDVSGTERELLLELGLPGVGKHDFDVQLDGDEVVVSGARPEETPNAEGRVYFHAEMARGPFRRVVPLPVSTTGAPRIEVEHGIVRIKLARAARSPLPRA